MLYAFPAIAPGFNWLNQAIIGTLTNGMNAIDAGEFPSEWQRCLPPSLPDDKRDLLARKPGLQNHINAFWEIFGNLADEEKEAVRNAIECQTNLPDLFANTIQCPSANDLPEEIRIKTNQLARYLFGQLVKIKDGEKYLRDIHFCTIHSSGGEVCPFCGLYPFRPPSGRRNELDHIMAISRYPFVAADFKNLAPICNECNVVKGDTDILVDENGNRRRCSNPYFGPVFTVCLAGSEFGNGNEIKGTKVPRWEINLLPDIPEATTWDTVYNIKARYKAILDLNYFSWIEHFAIWFVSEIGRSRSSYEVSAELCRYACNVVQYKLTDRAFLIVEVFKFLDRSCRDPDTGHEARNFLLDFVKHAT